MALETNIKTFLNGKHIRVPDEWIIACLQWIQSEQPALNVNNNKVILDKVYEQWLHCDLTELASCCLPFGLQQKRSTTINGHFALQVNQVRDVGLPAYTQLQKVRKVESGNALVSADQPHQPSWEPKPTRMIMMQMTDGTSMVQGMEYRFIPQINVNLKPGTKVLLSGSVVSRRGVLLLTKEHITILGGETEQLIIPNALENVLARALGVEETENPNMLEDMPATQVPPSQASQYYPSQLNNLQSRPQNNSQTPRGGGGVRGNRNSTSQVTRGNIRNNRQNAIISTMNHHSTGLDDLGDDDDFLDSDLEAALERIESQAESSVSSSFDVNKRTPFSNNSNNSGKKGKIGGDMSVKSSDYNMDVSDEFFNDDFGDEILLSAENSFGQTGMPSTSGFQQKSSNQFGDHSRNPSLSSNQFKNKNSSFPSRPSQNFGVQNNSTLFRQPTPVKSNLSQSTSKAVTQSKGIQASKNLKASSKQSRLTSFLKSSSSQPSSSQSFSSQPSNSQSSSSQAARPFPSAASSHLHSTNMDAHPDFKTPLSSGFSNPGTSGTRDMKMQSKVEASKESIIRRLQQEPFTYLIFIPKTLHKTQEFVIKGFIMTLTSKLEHSDGVWKLTVLVNDGSASCEVDIDNKILCELIGMDVQEFNIKKVEAKANPFLRSQLTKSVSGCQQKLISLCSLLKLRVSPDTPRPRLIEIIPITATVAQQLAQRCSSYL